MGRAIGKGLPAGLVVLGLAAGIAANAGRAADELSPAAGQILLEGEVRSVEVGEKRFVLNATAFTLPNGSSRKLPEARPKTILAGRATVYVRGDKSRTIGLDQLKAGTKALVLGQDLGSGKDLPARDVAVWDRMENDRYAFGPAEKPMPAATPMPVEPTAPAKPVTPPTSAPTPRATASTTPGALGGEWPQWRGPDRTGLSRETGLLASWPGGGPRLLWRVPGLGGGYSTPSVAGGKIYGMGYRGGEETVWCLDAASGRGLWATPIAQANRQVGYGEGSRCSPTVDGDRVYVLGVSGDLACLNASTGQMRWLRNFTREFGGQIPNWGYAESPLVDGNKVIACPGGAATMVAFDKMTGREIWRSRVPEGDQAQYASAIVADVRGQRQYIQLMQRGVIGVSASDGRFLWRWDRPANRVANCSTPIYRDGYVFAASGYNTGGGLARLTPNGAGCTVNEVYFTRDMKNHHGGMVVVGEHLYGFDEGILTCLELRTGRALWQERSVGKGAVAYADGHLYLRGENGGVALAEATPNGYVEKGRFMQPERSGKQCWPHPVVAGGKLLLRDQETLLCYDVSGK